MNESDWSTTFMKELGRELGARCNHGVTIFRHSKLFYKGIPDYSVTVRGKTVWLEFKLWKDGKWPSFPAEQVKTMDQLWTAFYVHIIVKEGLFAGVVVNREATWETGYTTGEAVRYLCSFFDLDTTELDY